MAIILFFVQKLQFSSLEAKIARANEIRRLKVSLCWCMIMCLVYAVCHGVGVTVLSDQKEQGNLAEGKEEGGSVSGEESMTSGEEEEGVSEEMESKHTKEKCREDFVKVISVCACMYLCVYSSKCNN